jgi:hypothetical protein
MLASPHDTRRELENIVDDHAKEVWMNDHNDRIRFGVEFTKDTTVCYNQLLEELRDAGFSVYAFGTNLEGSDNITATFHHSAF